MSVNIYTGFPTPGETDLIKQISESYGRDRIHVSQLLRFGFSGAKLILAFFSKKPEGIPYIIKTANEEDITNEFDAIESMKDLCADCKLEIHQKFTSGKFGALLYAHKGTDHYSEAENPLAFSKVLYVDESKFSTDNLTKALEEVYRKLLNAHSKASILERNVSKHFKGYLRDHVATVRIRAILGSLADEHSLNFLGTEIYNPLKFMNDLPKTVELHVGRVHGDLHPDNIILDRNNIPHLIDFAWAELPRDILVDFVLLENSIRFWHFPKSANLDEQMALDELLLEENGWKSIESIKISIGETKRIYHRLSHLVGTIRKMARSVLNDKFSMHQYLLTQFIVLYGLLRFDNYEQYAATRALGIIAKRLKESGV